MLAVGTRRALYQCTMRITLHDIDRADPSVPVWTGTLAEFCTDNEMSAEELAEMFDDLTETGVYSGGGGASPEYVLRVAS